MPDLQPTTALADKAARSFRIGSLGLEENDRLALASVTLRRGQAGPAPFGLILPQPGGWTGGDGVSAFWTGPDQWMVEGHDRAQDDFAAELALQCPDCSITGQTDGFVAFEIRSAAGAPAIVSLMTRLVNLDPTRLVPGAASRTGLDHMSVFVIRRAPGHLAVLGMRSAAGSLWHALETAITHLAERPA